MGKKIPMEKQKWVSPELIILVRRTEAEDSLLTCDGRDCGPEGVPGQSATNPPS